MVSSQTPPPGLSTVTRPRRMPSPLVPSYLWPLLLQPGYASTGPTLLMSGPCFLGLSRRNLCSKCSCESGGLCDLEQLGFQLCTGLRSSSNVGTYQVQDILCFRNVQRCCCNPYVLCCS